MTPRRPALPAFAACLALALSAPARGQPARTDLYGDPLPPGAVARLGTLRWRLPLPTSYALAFAPDGKSFFSVSNYGGLCLWDGTRGTVRRRVLDDDPLGLSNVRFAFSADASTLAVGRSLGTIVVLDTATGKERCRCLGHRGGIQRLALSADGRVLVSSAADGTIRVWDARTGRQRRRQQQPLVGPKELEYPYVRFALTGDGRVLAWAAESGRFGDRAERVLHVCDADTGRERRRLTERDGVLHDLVLSADGRLLASVAEGGLRLWDVPAGRPVPSFRDPGGPAPFFAVFAPDGKRLAVASFPPRRTRVLETSTGREVCRIPEFAGGAGRMLFTPDGRTLVLLDGLAPLIRRFDAATGEERVDYPGHRAGVAAVALSGDGRALVSAGHDPAVNVWDATGRHLRRLPATPPPNPPAVLSPDGLLFATARGKALRVREAGTGRELWAREAEGYALAGPSFSPGGRLLAAPGSGGAVVLREAATGKLLRELRALPAVTGTAFAAAGDQVLAWADDLGQEGASARRDTEAAVWETASGRLRRRLRLPSSVFVRMVLSPDGRSVLFASADRRFVECWEVAGGRRRFRIPQPEDVQALALAPDGGVLVTTCHEGRAADPGVSFRCYEVRDGRLLCEKRGHRAQVRALAFSGDGRRLATASDDMTVLVWDLPALLPPRPVPAAGPVAPESLWADLAAEDAARAYHAVQALVGRPDQALPLLKTRLRPAPAPVDPGRLARLLADLDGARFAVRQKAESELERLGEAAEPALERAREGRVSLEQGRRLDLLLGKLSKLREAPPPPERLRQVRALEVLEQVGTAEARLLLAELAGGAADAWLTHEARAALDRLAPRRPVTPAR